MAEEHQKIHECESNPTPINVESTDRGMFDFLGKKEEEKPQEEVIIVAEFEEKIKLSEQAEVKEEEEAEKKSGLLEKLHRSHSSSSSSSSDEEEVKEGGEKKKKKKGLKEKLKEKTEGDKKEQKKEDYEDTSIPIEKCDDVVEVLPQGEAIQPEEKKGFLEKFKEKLPGHNKKTEEASIPSPVPSPVVAGPFPVQEECAGDGHDQEGEVKEKKGFLEKIKEKFPGYHKHEEEKKEEAAAH